MAGREAGALRQGLGKGGDRPRAPQEPRQGPGTGDLVEKAAGGRHGAGRGLGVEEGQGRGGGGQSGGMAGQIRGADGLEVRAQDGLHRQLPAGRDLEFIEQPGRLGQALGGQPGGGGAIAVGQRRLLEGGEGGVAAPGRLELGAGLVQLGGQVAPGGLLGAPGGRQPVAVPGAGRQGGVQVGLAPFQGRDLFFEFRGGEAAQFLVQARQPGLILTQALFQMIDAGPLQLGLLGRARRRAIEVVPLGLPGLEGRLRRLDAGLGGLAVVFRHQEGRLVLGQSLVQFRQGRQVPVQQAGGCGAVPFQAGQLDLLAAAVLAGELNALLQPGDLGAHGIVPALDLIEVVRGLGKSGALGLDIRFQLALARQVGLQDHFLPAQCLVALAQILVQGPPAQGLELGVELALLRLEALVFLGGGGLPFQVQELLGDLLAQIREPVQVLAGVADAGLGLAAALLVLGDAGGLLQKEPQVLGTRLDEARDHALLDDGVTAGAQTGAEEEILDVPAPAAGTVEEVVGLAVAADLALDRDLGVLGVFAPGTPIRVVEEEFDGGQADRLAAGGAVEDDVGHGLAAQHLGRGFTHDPAHGVDDI